MLLILIIVVILIVVALIASTSGFDGASPARELSHGVPARELTSSAQKEIAIAEEYDEDDYEADEAFDVDEAMFTTTRQNPVFEGFFEPAGAFTPVGTNEADGDSICYTYGQMRRDCQCDHCKQWRRAREN